MEKELSASIDDHLGVAAPKLGKDLRTCTTGHHRGHRGARRVKACARKPTAVIRCQQVIADGSALERFAKVVAAQGGDPCVCDDPAAILPRARKHIAVPATADGFLVKLSARAVGQASMLLGAGRARVDAEIDPAVGLVLHAKVGEQVRVGDTIATLHVNAVHEAAVSAALATLEQGITISDDIAPRRPLIVKRLPEEALGRPR
jgi:thymidine phosphorylase